MSRFGSSSAQSGGTGASRMLQRVTPQSSSRLHLEEYPLGEETGLPLIPCPDCGLARVIEKRSGKETTKNYLRVFFKCPRNGFPKLCGHYQFQREYLDKLVMLGIVRIRAFPAMEIGDEATTEGQGDATSGNTGREMKVEAKKDGKKDAKFQAKMEDLMWKFNLLMLFLLFFLVLYSCTLQLQ